MTARLQRIGLGTLAFGLALVFFGMRAAPGLTFEDSGELAAAAASFGVPHPPGYPLLMIVGGLLAKVGALVGLGAATVLVWVSVVCGAVTVGCVTRFVAGPHGERPVAGLVAGGLLLLAPTFAAQAVVVEVYALSTALSAALLLAASAGRARVCGLLFGLGLAAHPAGLFNLPLLVFGLVRAGKLSTTLPRATIGVLLGLLPYVYVPLAASRGPAVNWGGVHDLGSLLDHLLRRQFGVTPTRDFTAQATFLGEHLVGQWPLVIVATLIGVALVRTKTDDEVEGAGLDAAVARYTRMPLVFTTLLVTAGGLFWAQHWPVTEEITRVRLAGSFAPVVLWMAAFVGLGLARIEGRFSAGGRTGYRLPMLLVLLFLASFHPAPDYSSVAPQGSRYTPGRATLASFQAMGDVDEAEAFARFVLEGVPPGSLVVVNRLGYSDILSFPLMYGQVVLGLGPDVVVVNREMLALEWYRKQLVARRAELAAPLERLANTLAAQPTGDPRARRLANVPFLRELVTLFPGEVAFIGRPSARIANGFQLTATDAAWWLTPEGASAPSNDPPAWPFLAKDAYPDPWRAELKSMARERDAFRAQ